MGQYGRPPLATAGLLVLRVFLPEHCNKISAQ